MIIVTDTIFIDSDEQQWTARKKQISKSGKSKGNEVTVLIGYYPSIEAALRGILRNEYGGRMNIVNDGDVKTWTKTTDGVPTTLSEILTLNFFMDPFFNGRQQDRYYLNAAGDMSTYEAQATGANIRGAVNMEINLKYIVQFKDLRQQARYPNTVTTDQDITQRLTDTIGDSGNPLQSWTTAST